MSIPQDDELDRPRVEALIKAIGTPVRDYYRAQETRGQLHVYEVLNGLACVTAMVMAGTAPFGLRDCLTFFSEALHGQIHKTLADQAEMAEKGKPQ
jgi:hypothetical protein